MMDLNKHVISLDLAIRLMHLKINKNSLFYYFRQFQEDDYLLHCIDYNYNEADIKIFQSYFPDNYPAFSASELGDILPNCITIKGDDPFNNFRIAITKFISVENNTMINNYVVNYECDTTEVAGQDAWLRRKLTQNIYDPNLANAMAKMLIFLIENKLVNI